VGDEQEEAGDDEDVGHVEDRPEVHVDEVDHVPAGGAVDGVAERPADDEREAGVLDAAGARAAEPHREDDGRLEERERDEERRRRMEREALERAEGDAAVLRVEEVDPGREHDGRVVAEGGLGGELGRVVAADEAGDAGEQAEKETTRRAHVGWNRSSRPGIPRGLVEARDDARAYDGGVIIPISHERMSARRLPVVTAALIVACIVVQIVLTVRGDHGGDGNADARTHVVEYFTQHPYLSVKPDAIPELDAETVQMAHMASGAIEAPDEAARASEQKELDALVAEATRAAATDDPIHRFGYVPASPSVLALFTSQFVHSGWFHLLGNMYFLVLCGMTLEDRWGRLVFPLFYLASGAVAALSHGLLHPHDTAPLVGASGAIAGCMGAFAVALARTRMRFALLVTFRPRTFTAPAFVVLPFWAAFEALWGWVLPGDGTAHFAHVGGFVFGVVAATVLRWTGVDRRLDDSVEKVAKLGDDPRVDEARLLVQRGDPKLALAMLEGLAIEKPDSAHVQDAIAEAARAMGDDARVQKAVQRATRLRAAP
jgi:membrane associated rhomboid family serine protease